MGISPLLEIPEILSNVLRFLDYPSLFRAAQVNSLWAEHATNWLWRGQYRGPEDSHSRALQTLHDACPDRKRRNWYTEKIRYLDLEQCDERNDLEPVAHLLEKKLFTFPHLKSVIVDLGSENMDEAVMVQLLSRGLITLELYGGQYTTWFLGQIQIKSPCLRYFLVDNTLREESDEEINATDFKQFLEEMPSITHLELNQGWETLMDDVWRSIMLRPNLEFFAFNCLDDFDWRNFARTATDSLPEKIFPSLRFLDIATDAKTFQILLPNLSVLQGVSNGLYLDSFGSNPLTTTLQSLTSCPLLENADLWGTAPVTSTDLLNLASSCPLLRSLKVGAKTLQFEDCLDDGQFNTFVSRLKHLTTLCLGLPVNLSSQSLVSVALHCPQMRDLRINAVIDIKELEAAPDLIQFPCVGILVVADVFIDGKFCSSSTASSNWIQNPNRALERIMDSRFPALKHFAFYPTRVRPEGTQGNMSPGGLLIARTSDERVDERPSSEDLPSRLIRALVHPVPGDPYNSRF